VYHKEFGDQTFIPPRMKQRPGTAENSDLRENENTLSEKKLFQLSGLW
jgi:hypothetical protein